MIAEENGQDIDNLINVMMLSYLQGREASSENRKKKKKKQKKKTHKLNKKRLDKDCHSLLKEVKLAKMLIEIFQIPSTELGFTKIKKQI